jgi:DNA-binding CsgD family transcriptional regulator
MPFADAERAVLRDRRALLVGAHGRCTNAAFARMTGCRDYAVAVVLSNGPPEYLVHADRAPRRGPVRERERDILEAFAGGLGLVLDSIRLRRTLGEHERRLQSSLAAAAGPVEGCARDLTALDVDSDQLSGQVDPPLPPLRSSRAALLLSPREREVMELVAQGQRNRQIAEQLVLSEETIKSHVSSIMRKLRAGSRAEAVARYLRLAAPGDAP